MLASKPQYSASASLGMPAAQASTATFHSTSQRPATATKVTEGFGFASPTKSEFSDGQDEHLGVRAWDEKKVVAWLHSIKCGQYESLFRANNFNGDNLIDCDQKILQEMGIKKVGDRVRIFVAIKQLRNKTMVDPRQKNMKKLAVMEAAVLAENTRPILSRRWSRDGYKSSSQPASPPADSDRTWRKDGGYLTSGSGSGRNPSTPGASHPRNNSLDGLTMGPLPQNSPVIRVIYTGGQTKVLDIRNSRTPEEVIISVLRKLQLPEHQYRNYCFYVLDGLEPDLSNCRKLTETELMEICEGVNKSERGRLILRKIHAGEPDQDELRRASQLAYDESKVTHENALNKSNFRQKNKIQQLTGESWNVINTKQPISPVGARHRPSPTPGDQGQQSPGNDRTPVGAKLRSFFGQRPPSEMIIHELQSFFPSHDREDIAKTMRRSQRLSRAASRLSVVSNYSVASSLKDAPPLPPLPPIPPMPNIADSWFQPPQAGAQAARASRPPSLSKFNLPHTSYRDSIASSSLQPLQEESPTEPNRKSYVSFESSSDEPNPSRQSMLDESMSVAATDGDSFNDERMSVLIGEAEAEAEVEAGEEDEEGEEEDDDDAGLMSDFLAGNNFAPKNWMKGSLIGEGSFGSVFLALHAITGELMAVKQVEIPSATQGTEFDKRKNLMVTALKHEIELLQGMHHPNIVQYLGTATDDQYLNIFLEYVPGGSIATMLKQYNTFQEPLVKNFVRQILAGLSYLHSCDIIHRDIKGANILVDNKGGVKISDFGISKRVEASTVLGSRASTGGGSAGHMHRPSMQGSVYWMAPEVVRQTAHTKKADIWSLGCLVVEMFIGAHPFPDCSQLQAIFAIGSNKARPHTPEHVSEEAGEFLDMTFQHEYEKRPSADELLKCKFLAMPIT